MQAHKLHRLPRLRSTRGATGLCRDEEWLCDELERRCDILGDHSALAFLNEEAWAGLKIGGKDTYSPKQVLGPSNLVRGAGRDYPLAASPLGDVIDRLDYYVSHQQPDFCIGNQGELFLQDEGALLFFDRNDVLGWPLRPLSQSYDRVVTEDVEINSGTILEQWNPMSHSAYWRDRDVLRPIARFIRQLLKEQR